MKIYTQVTARQSRFKGETNPSPSLTIPDQAITPQELLRRYATGQPLGFKNVDPIYDESDDTDEAIPEFYKMDNLDRLHAIQENAERVHELHSYRNAEISKIQQQEKQKKADAAKKERETTNSAAKNDEQRRNSESAQNAPKQAQNDAKAS